MKVKVFGMDLRVLRFVMAMVRRKTNGDEYGLSVVCGLAVIGVRESGWVSAVDFGPPLSAILKCLRLVVLVDCFQSELAVEEIEEWKDDEGFPWMEMVTERVNDSMVRGTRGAVWWMIEKRAYAMNVGMAETREGQMSWRDNGERVVSEWCMEGLSLRWMDYEEWCGD